MGDPRAHPVDPISGALSREYDPRRPFAAGDLVRIRRGSYYPTEQWVALDDVARFRLTLEAFAWANPGAVFCGETALFLDGIPVVKAPTTIDVATTSRSRLGASSSPFDVRGSTDMARRARSVPSVPVRRHFHASIDPVDTDGHLTVAPEVALVETLIHGKFARALTVADGLLRREPSVPLLDRAPITSAINNLQYATHRRRVETTARLARVGAESPGESVSRAIMLLFGFQEPLLQVEHSDAAGFIGRTDFTWPPGLEVAQELNLERVGEFDGWGKYFNAALHPGEDAMAVIRREKRRENRLLASGRPVLRWTWAELERPALLRARLIEGGLRPKLSAAIAI